MIEVNNLSKIFGEDYILEDISFTLKPTDKVGIVGVNGSGKSTLLKCMIFEDYVTQGEVKINGSVGYVDQSELLDDKKTLQEQYLEIFPDIYNISKYLNNNSNKENHTKEEAEEYIQKEQRFRDLGGYDIKIKIDKLLTGFGFAKEVISKQVCEFSGGEKTKLSLIKLLLLEPDYLFLDEPTNHLDLNAIIWLEKYLKSLKKSIILVSHDEVFLNSICNKIILVENKKIKIYNTNFNNYQKQRKLDYENDLNEYKNNVNLLKKYEEFVNKNRGKPTKIGQVNDRKAKIEKLKTLEKPIQINRKINFEFEGYHLKKAAYLSFYDVNLGYDAKSLIKGINFQVYGGEKVAIIGRNGIGKSTLFKAILDGKGQSGKIKIPSIIKIGYFDQNQEQINHQKTLYDLIHEKDEFDSQSAIRKYLGSFLFQRDEVFKKFGALSGGEKVRFTLALMALDKYDVLLLDEPTNHLDIEVKNILIQVLKNFPATILFITHDRKLIDEVATKTLYLDETGVSEFLGSWDDYITTTKLKINKVKKTNQEERLQNTDKKSTDKSVKIKTDQNINTQKLKKIEEDIIILEQKQQQYFKDMQDEKILKDYKKLEEVTNKLNVVTEQLEHLYKDYDSIFK